MKFATKAIHAGQPNDPQTGSVNVPVYQTATYGQESPGVTKGYCYSRTEHPTRRALEENLAALEGAKHALAFASGLAAITAVLGLLRAGAHVVAGMDIYGGTWRLFERVFSKFGVETTFVDTTDLAAVADAVRADTAMLWLESPSNPLLTVTDLVGAAKAARGKASGIRVVVDNTFATPFLQRPLEHGADIVVHSTTKYLGGHSDVIGGGVCLDDDATREELLFLQNTMGGVPGPQDCFLVLRGIKTLAVRMREHCGNARRIAEFLEGHPRVARVHYPGLASHPGHAVAALQMDDFGGMVSFEIAGDGETARRFTQRTELFTLAESLGGVKSLLCQPATMTHVSVDPEVRRKRGVTDTLLRLSVGIEDAGDLIADLDRALAAETSA